MFSLKYEKYLSFLSETFQFLEIKFSIYLNRHVFVMETEYMQSLKFAVQEVFPAYVLKTNCH